MSTPAAPVREVEREHDTFPGLDSLRALAALCVLGTHVSFWAGGYDDGLLGAMTARLDLGVAIFFVLSGFLLGRPFLAAMADGRSRPTPGRYLWKRALRIVPLYAITVVIALAALPENRGAGWETWLRTLTFTQIYTPDGTLTTGLTHMWSLCVEVAFYLFLPALMWLVHRVACRRGWEVRRVLASLVVLALVNWVWLALAAPRLAGSNLWPPAYLAWFAGGMALAAIAVEVRRPGGRSFAGLVSLAGQPGVCWSLALAVFAIAATPLAGPILLIEPTVGQAITKNVLYVVIACLVLMPSILGPRAGTGYADALSWRWLRHVGLISYGIFCLHLLVIDVVTDVLDLPLYQGNGWQLVAVTITASVVLAEIAYRLVERPSLRLRNVRSRPSKPTATATPNASSTHH